MEIHFKERISCVLVLLLVSYDHALISGLWKGRCVFIYCNYSSFQKLIFNWAREEKREIDIVINLVTGTLMWMNAMHVPAVIQMYLCISEHFQQKRWGTANLRFSVLKFLTFLFQIKWVND